MTTALTIIEDALGEIGVYGAGETISADDAAKALRYLNRILQGWSNHRLMFPSLTEVSVTLDGSGSYTIGPSGADVTAARPNKIISAYVRDSAGLDSHIDVLAEAEWHVITDKTLDAAPSCVWYEKTNTSGTLHVHPDVAGYTLKLQCQTLLASFGSLVTSLTLPEGYESALILRLAIDLCGSFERPVPAALPARATVAARAIKRTNYEPLLMNIAEAQDYDINRGY